MDLIANGDFTIPNVTGSVEQFKKTQHPNFKWDIAWVVDPAPTSDPLAEVQKTAADGQYLELASTAPYSISQTIAPQPGEDYVFSFRAKARSGYPSKFLARLKMSNGVIVEYHIDPPANWRTYTFCQCPTAGEVVVTFVGLGKNAGGAFLDDVRYVN